MWAAVKAVESSWGRSWWNNPNKKTLKLTLKIKPWVRRRMDVWSLWSGRLCLSRCRSSRPSAGGASRCRAEPPPRASRRVYSSYCGGKEREITNQMWGKVLPGSSCLRKTPKTVKNILEKWVSFSYMSQERPLEAGWCYSLTVKW